MAEGSKILTIGNNGTSKMIAQNTENNVTSSQVLKATSNEISDLPKERESGTKGFNRAALSSMKEES